jgi:hypothetical protein
LPRPVVVNISIGLKRAQEFLQGNQPKRGTHGNK